MANRDNKWDDNVEGKFYVDKECILCSLCHELAPANFKEADSGDHDVVFKQPTTQEETDACIEAMDNCPVEAIGDDGSS